MNSRNAFRLLNSDDPFEFAEWLRLWSEWENREVYAHPAYVRLNRDLLSGWFRSDGEGEERKHICPDKGGRKAMSALCAVWESDLGVVLYPILVRDLSFESYWLEGCPAAFDIITPYGYGGPFLCRGSDPDALAADFWPAFYRWTHSRLIVSELIRFSLFDADLLPYPFGREHVFDNVVRSLDVGEDALWLDFEHKVRKNVNRAHANGVTIEVDSVGSRLDDFLRIYTETMERRHADLFYSFPRAYFEALHADLPGQFCYFHANHQGRVISTELVLVSQSRVYSFLGGTESASSYLRPNDLLKYEIILWAKRNGKTAFVLGGGYQRDDGIFRYKKSFAPCGTKAFFLGKRVLDEFTYARLVENRNSKARKVGTSWEPSPGFFPAYRG